MNLRLGSGRQRFAPGRHRVRRDAQAFGLVVSLLVAAAPSLACDAFDGTPEDGAQERLRNFKTDATGELARLDAKLSNLKTLSSEAGSSVGVRNGTDHLVQRREQLGRRIESLVIDARSRWDETQAELDAQLEALHRDVDAALDAVRNEAK